MTNSVSLLGLFAPPQGARDAKVNEDNMLASFAGVLAGVNQANAKLLPPTPQVEGGANGEALENSEDGDATGDAKQADETSTASPAAAAPTGDVTSAAIATVADPNAVNSSVAALNPALQEKLARVISRMRDETGHDVQVTETYRSQSRQNELYAQGRETAGPVVTWTQNSKHTQGRAVDVTLDGGRASADAYKVLRRIANEEGLRTLGAKDPGHLELPSKSATTSQALNDVMSVPDEPADASGPRQVSVARSAHVATPAGKVAAPAQVAQVATVTAVASVAQVASVASVGTSSVRGTRVNAMNSKANFTPTTTHAKHQPTAKPGSKAPSALTLEMPAVNVTSADATTSDVSMSEPRAQDVFAQADGVADMPIVAREAESMKPVKFGANGEITIGDATGNSSDDDSLITRIADAATPTATPAPAQNGSRQSHKPFEISHLDRLSDAVNASRVEDASTKTQSPATKAQTKSQVSAGAMQFRAPSIGRSANNNQGFSSDRQSSDRDTSGYSTLPLRTETTTHFSVADVATQMTSTASQRAERIMAAQDAPARPLSQIVMSVDAGNGTTDRIQVALRGSTVSATIDTPDHHVATAMRANGDELVRSLTKDGVDVESVRVRSTGTTATATAPVTTADSSQKSSDSSNNSRFSREAQWDQQRSQQRSNNNERRHQQREQRGGKES